MSGITVKWNDQTNSSYFEQFVKIMNSALPLSNSIGNPLKSALMQGYTNTKISLKCYKYRTSNLPVY